MIPEYFVTNLHRYTSILKVAMHESSISLSSVVLKISVRWRTTKVMHRVWQKCRVTAVSNEMPSVHRAISNSEIYVREIADCHLRFPLPTGLVPFPNSSMRQRERCVAF